MPRVTSAQISAQLRDEATLATHTGHLGRAAELRQAAREVDDTADPLTGDALRVATNLPR